MPSWLRRRVRLATENSISPAGVVRGIERVGAGVTLRWALVSQLRRISPYLFGVLVRALEAVSYSRSEIEADERTITHRVGKPERFEVTTPERLDDWPLKILDNAGHYAVSEPTVVEVPDVTLVGRCPVPLDAEGTLVTMAVGKSNVALLNVLRSWPALIRYAVGRTRTDRTVDHAVLLHNAWSDGYFHWVLDDLTRLQGVERLVEQGVFPRPKVVVGPDPPTWQLEYLRLLGYTDDDVIRHAGTTLVENLVVPSMRREGEVSPEALDWLVETISASIDVGPEDGPDRIYVSRSDASRRRVLNEDDLVDALADLGFERYVLTDLNVREQVALFSGAETVVAPHGANLTNVIFCDDARVVELYADWVSEAYAVLSSLRGNGHEFVKCEPVGPHMLVDPDEVVRRVEST